MDTINWEGNNNYREFKKALEAEGWYVKEDHENKILEVQWFSPAGGDFRLDIEMETAYSDFCFQAEGFDVDEYVMFWYGKKKAPTTIRELLEDAEAIQKELLRVNEILLYSKEDEEEIGYNIIGNIGEIIIKWHPIYEYSLWERDRCMSEHSSLIEAIGEICESYSYAINNTEKGGDN